MQQARGDAAPVEKARVAMLEIGDMRDSGHGRTASDAISGHRGVGREPGRAGVCAPICAPFRALSGQTRRNLRLCVDDFLGNQ